MQIPAFIYHEGEPGTTLRGGLPTPSGGTLLTTLSLVNTSGSTQAANFVSPMFGQAFVSGDLPAGEYPEFLLDDDTPVPATVYSDAAWPDGSKMFCGVFLRSPTAIAASSTLNVNVMSAGSAPAASSRTLADLAAADISVEVTGVSGLSGTWVASLNTAITDADEILEIGDGPAGKVWRIRGDFKQSGTPHGQLVCYHFALAGENESGGFYGIRYLGLVEAPWVDVTSPAKAPMVVTAVLKTGATTIRQIQGNNTSETVGDNIALPHYGGFATCGPDAKWDFIQGGGSASADCTVRAVQEMQYFSKAQVLPSYDFSVTPNTRPVSNYYAHGAGSMVRATGNTGDRNEIAVMPGWVAFYVTGKTENAEREVRVNAMVTTGWRTAGKLSTTGQIVPTTSPSASYAGLGTNQPTWRYNGTGMPFPSPNTSLWSGEIDGHHRGGCTFPAYLFTAEPQYLKLLVEQAANFIAVIPAGSGATWVTTDPVTSAWSGEFHSRDPIIDGTSYKGAGLLMRDDIPRYSAWMLRDLVQAAAIYPNTCPAGTEVKKYLREVAENNWAAFVAYRNALSADYRDNGIFALKPAYIPLDSTWAIGFLSGSFAHQYGLLKNPNTFICAQHLANFWKRIEEEVDAAACASVSVGVFDSSGARINTVSNLFFQPQDLSVTYSASANTLTFTGANNSFGFANGDQILANATYVAGTVDRQRLYIINKSGRAFQVSDTLGGSPLDIIADGAVFGPLLRIADFSPTLSMEGYLGTGNHLSSVTGAIKNLKAIGCTGIDIVVADMSARVVAAAIPYATNPKNAMSASLPV